jgi:hypothetical protein
MKMDLQELINSGAAWTLEGSVGRAAMACINSGCCVLGEVGHIGCWGNYVPSRTEVQAGPKGSLEYAENAECFYEEEDITEEEEEGS